MRFPFIGYFRFIIKLLFSVKLLLVVILPAVMSARRQNGHFLICPIIMFPIQIGRCRRLNRTLSVKFLRLLMLTLKFLTVLFATVKLRRRVSRLKITVSVTWLLPRVILIVIQTVRRKEIVDLLIPRQTY